MLRIHPLFLGAAVLAALFGARPAAAAGQFYVSTEGNDTWSGALAAPNAARTDGPFATLERARDAVRELKQPEGLKKGGIYVNLRGGVYPRTEPFELGAADSGAPGAPVVYRSYGKEKARLMGGVLVTGFAPVTAPEVLNRLDEAARGEVRVLDLKAAGITAYGTLARGGFGLGAPGSPIELFFRGKRMQLARWPNGDWLRIEDTPGGSGGGQFTYSGDRPGRWKSLDDLWVHGYWTWDWADSYEKVQKLDSAARTVSTEPPHGVYGYKKGARFYFLNVLEELDQPGEYYVDRANGLLYFWPPEPLAGSEALVSLAAQPLVAMKDASYATLSGLSLEGGRNGGVLISGGSDNRVEDCVLACFATTAVVIEGGARHSVRGCVIRELGAGGVSLAGGDRMTLAPAGHCVEDCDIHDYGMTVRTYTPAVSLAGAGSRVSHNRIYNAPHEGIGLGGNDHVIEFNETHHVCMETHDAGAFYMGRDWSQRGNVVRYNYFHHLGTGDVQAVYLDDWTSGVLVYGNICHGALRGVLVGGGRDNTIENNIFVDCKIGVHIDQRGLGWAKSYFDGTDNTLFDRLKAVNGTQPLYTQRYPELATLLEDDPVLAKNNKVVRNIFVCEKWLDLMDGLDETTPYLTLKDNFTQGDPGFIDRAAADYRLRKGAPPLQQGFKPIPVEQIGPRKGTERPAAGMAPRR